MNYEKYNIYVHWCDFTDDEINYLINTRRELQQKYDVGEKSLKKNLKAIKILIQYITGESERYAGDFPIELEDLITHYALECYEKGRLKI